MPNVTLSRSFEVLTALLCLAILNVKGVSPSRIAISPSDISILADYDKACDLGASIVLKKRSGDEKLCLLGSFTAILDSIKQCDGLRTD